MGQMLYNHILGSHERQNAVNIPQKIKVKVIIYRTCSILDKWKSSCIPSTTYSLAKAKSSLECKKCTFGGTIFPMQQWSKWRVKLL